MSFVGNHLEQKKHKKALSRIYGTSFGFDNAAVIALAFLHGRRTTHDVRHYNSSQTRTHIYIKACAHMHTHI